MNELQTSGPTPQESVAQLKRMLEVARFKSARVQARLLRFVVMQTLARKELNETIVGLAVFREDYDPASHKVRQNASLLRTRIADYYASEGANDMVKIAIQPGGYLASFSYNVQSAALRHYSQALSYRKDIFSMSSWAMAQSLLLKVMDMTQGKFAPAHALHAENDLIWVLLDAISYRHLNANEQIKAALIHAALAANLDPKSGFAQIIMGAAYLLRYQQEKAKVCFDTALKLSPSITKASLWYATYLLTTGDTEAALQIARSQVNEHPGSFEMKVVCSLFLYAKGEYEEASELLHEIRSMGSAEELQHFLRDLLHLAEGHPIYAALSIMDRSPLSEQEWQSRELPSHAEFDRAKPFLGLLALSCAQAGRLDVASNILENLRRHQPKMRLQLALAYLAVGRNGRAIAALHLAMWQDRDVLMNWVHLIPLFNPLHTHPHFSRFTEDLSRFV